MNVIQVKKLHPDAIIPEYQSEGAAGFDLHSIEDIVIAKNSFALVQSGLAFALEAGYELQIRPRSGLAVKYGITVLNSPGTIDSDYRGEIGIILANHSVNDFVVKKHDRIAQGVLQLVHQATFELTQTLSQTQRGEGGLGSTGVS